MKVQILCCSMADQCAIAKSRFSHDTAQMFFVAFFFFKSTLMKTYTFQLQ